MRWRASTRAAKLCVYKRSLATFAVHFAAGRDIGETAWQSLGKCSWQRHWRDRLAVARKVQLAETLERPLGSRSESAAGRDIGDRLAVARKVQLAETLERPLGSRSESKERPRYLHYTC